MCIDLLWKVDANDMVVLGLSQEQLVCSRRQGGGRDAPSSSQFLFVEHPLKRTGGSWEKRIRIQMHQQGRP